MSRLLFVYERDMPTVSITRDVFTRLRKFPEIEADFVYLSDVSKNDINSHDIIVFIRPEDNYSWRVAEKARKAGHITVTFCDDDLLNLPTSMPTMPWRKRGLIKTLASSDVIWSSSRYILEKYRSLTFGKRVAVIDTIIQPEEIEGIIPAENEKVRIVYAAAPSHAALFEKYIAPIVPKLVDEFNICFTFVSVHPNIAGIDCEYISGMPLLEYRKYMRENRFDIGLAPLDGDEFTKCKYYNKFIEYTTQGIVGVYSKTEPYTYVVRDGENGFMASNDPGDWYRALKEAIIDMEKRKTCLNNAIDYLRQEHSEDACIEKIRHGLPEIVDVSTGYRKCENFEAQKMIHYLTRPLDWLYLFVFHLKHTGVKSVIKRAKMHYTESKAYRRRSHL